MAPTRWLPIAAVCVSLVALGKPPTLDEESYLWIGRNMDQARPYDWARIWPPYAADSFVFAHPPGHLLWASLWGALPVVAARLLSLPWVVLLAWSVGRLAERTCAHPGLAGALWISATTAMLGLQNSLMIDLPMTALVMLGVALVADGADGGRTRQIAAGLAFGLAMAWKYPALLMLPVLLTGQPRGVGIVAGVASLVFLLTEGWIAATYGRVHLWEVWLRREEIAHGELGGRVLGTVLRVGFLPLPGALLVGGVWLARGHVQTSAADHRGVARILTAMVIVWIAGVALLHNYAAARYLLPAAAPMAILVARWAGPVLGGVRAAWVGVGLSGALAVAVGVADFRYVQAGVEVADAAMAKVGDRACRFAGEWSFRWRMEAEACVRYRPGEALDTGTIVVVVDNASAGDVPREDWEPVARVESLDRFPLRVNDVDRGASMYAETLGPLPLGWDHDALEGATLFQVR